MGTQRVDEAMVNIVQLVEKFKGLRPQLESRLGAAAKDMLKQEGHLKKTLIVLRDRGIELEHDGMLKMSEADAKEYAKQLEAFEDEYVSFVNKAEEKLRGNLNTLNYVQPLFRIEGQAVVSLN